MTAVMNSQTLITRHDIVMEPDDRRVVIKLFVPGEDAQVVQNRASSLIERILQLDEDETARLLDDVLTRFAGRHHDILGVFQHHYELVQHRVPAEIELSPTARTLIGAYFSHEFAVEAAALCNPSMVPHPDQTDLEPGELRVAISLRQIGEGHISSIGFCYGGARAAATRSGMEDRGGPLMIGQRVGAKHLRQQLSAALVDADIDNEASAYLISALPERYTDEEFEDVLGARAGRAAGPATSQATLDRIRHIVGGRLRGDLPGHRAAAPAGALAGHPGREQRHGGRPVRPGARPGRAARPTRRPTPRTTGGRSPAG